MSSPTPGPRRALSELRVGLIAAALMLAISLTAKLAARVGWKDTSDFAERSLMVIIAGFIVFTGNTIPKRLIPRACLDADPARIQAFLRMAGWTWVLAGLAFGLANAILPRSAATTATFIIMPVAIAIVGVAWLRLYGARRRPA